MADMRARILISLLSLATICFGVRYAIGRERLRSPEYARVLYQQTNKEFFEGQLPDLTVKVEDLSEANAEGETYKENEERFVIVLDPKWNTSNDEALETMRHESCHVATWGQEPDEHGPRFQDCMKRFPKE
jgi:SprT-like family